jgi:hypothetical protein
VASGYPLPYGYVQDAGLGSTAAPETVFCSRDYFWITFGLLLGMVVEEGGGGGVACLPFQQGGER